MARRKLLTNGRIAFLAGVILLSAIAVEQVLQPGATDAADIATDGRTLARMEADVLHLALAAPLDLAPGPASFTLTINDATSIAAASVEAGDNPTRWLVRFPVGVGSADRARLEVHGAGAASTLGSIPVAVDTPPGVLPSPRYGSAVAQTGSVVYLFGGHGWPNGTHIPLDLLQEDRPTTLPLDTILRVDLATGDVRTMGARLPEPRGHAVAMWDPLPTPDCPTGCAYVVGGAGRSGDRLFTPLGTILRYEPTSDALSTLPDPTDYCCRIAAAVAWAGTHAYIAGGGNGWVDRFVPHKAEMVTIGPIPPVQRYGMGSAFDPRESLLCPSGCMYLFGGVDQNHDADPVFHDGPLYADHILRMAPREQPLSTVVPAPARLPRTLANPASAWDGERAYVLGGMHCSPFSCGPLADVVAFDPATNVVETLAEPLGAPLYMGSALWHEGEIVVVDGITSDGETLQPLRAMMRYRPAG